MIIIGIDPGAARVGVVTYDSASRRVVYVRICPPAELPAVMHAAVTAHPGCRIACEQTLGGRAAGLPAALRESIEVQGWVRLQYRARMIRRVDVLRALGVPLGLPSHRVDRAVRDVLEALHGGSTAVGGERCRPCKGRGWTGRDHLPCPECDGRGASPPGPLFALRAHPQDVWDALAVAVAVAVAEEWK